MNLELIIIGLLFIFSLILLFKNPKAALYVLLVLSVLLHKELFSIYMWDLMPIRVFMMGFLVFTVLKLFIWLWKTRNFKELLVQICDPFILTLLVLWLVRALSLFFTRNFAASVSLLGFFTTMVALGIYLYSYFNHKPHETLSYIKAYIYIIFGLCIFGILQIVVYTKTGFLFGSIWNIPGHLPRIGSLFWDVNHFGGLLAGLLPVLGALILIPSSWKQRFLYMFLSLPIVFILLLTNSRTSWISVGVSGLVFVIALLFRRFKARGVATLVLILFLATLPFIREYQIKSSPFRAQIKQYFNYRMDSFDSHFLLLGGSWQIFEMYPFLGGGYGSFFEQFSRTKIAATFYSRDPAAFSVRVPAHTIWGELVAETGVFGLTAFLLFILVGVVPLLYLSQTSHDKKDMLLSTAMFSAIVGWLTAGIFYSYNSEFFWLVFFLYFIYGIKMVGKDGLKRAFAYFTQSAKLGFIVIALLSVFLVFLNLGKNHLLPWDEAIYAQISKNMVLSGDYVVQRWFPTVVWYEKPPLGMWFMAFSMKLFGFGSFAARLPSALFGIGTILVVYLFGKKMFNKTVGFISALTLLTTFNFLYYARASMLDVTATFFITLALYCFWLFKENASKKAFLISAVSTGLAIMTKGVVGFIPFAVIFLYELYLLSTKKSKLSWRFIGTYALYFALSALIFLPWHLEMYRRFGPAFLKNYIGYHVIDRATTAIEDKGKPFWWYFVVMKVSMRIWFVALIPAFALVLFRIFRKSYKHVFLLVWALFIFFLYSSAASKLKWYIIPIYPVTAIMVGYFLEQVIDFVLRKAKFLDAVLVKALMVFLILIGGVFYLFLNRSLVYETDLTGAQAILLEEKDQIFGTNLKVYADRIDLPLILYYSNSPYEVVDMGPMRERMKNASPDDQLIFITKESRLRTLQITYPNMQLIDQQKEWVLAFSSGNYHYDPEKKLVVPILPSAGLFR